jgi:hypothetical protein
MLLSSTYKFFVSRANRNPTNFRSLSDVENLTIGQIKSENYLWLADNPPRALISLNATAFSGRATNLAPESDSPKQRRPK